ncbi:tyrosine-type recombinase/integrase [Agrococcus sediminis]|uniref:Tyrosine-type recombinase/integrase n=1 Tax=Agrococcus sediminis TaxID=2599924 RepID=A0A5M8QK35_9MICO|nr:site-specific integrase [Agrococcus sediminis]KAA6436399.1 tyrosine-type recombinase/integrase [Agrococcus sediminis]
MTVKSANGRKQRVWRTVRTYYVDDKPKKVSVDRKTPQASIEAFELAWARKQVELGLLPASELPDAAKPKPRSDGRLYGSVIDEWWEVRKTKGRAEGTLNADENLLNLHIRPAFAHRTLSAITEADVRKFLNETLTEKGLGGSVKRRCFLTVREVFTHAIRRGYTTTDPCRWIEAPVYEPEVRNADNSKRTWMPERMLEKMRGTTEESYWVMAFLGLRQSERLGLGWSSFENLANRRKTAFVAVDRQLERYKVKDAADSPTGKAEWGLRVKWVMKTKNGERTFALSEEVREALLRWKKQQDEWKKSEGWKQSDDAAIADLVFTNPDGTPIKHVADNKAWHKLFDRFSEEAVKAGRRPWAQVRGHDMRHIAATILAKEGVPPRHATKILGHGTEAMTSYYTHLDARDTIESVGALTSAIFARSLKTLDEEVAEGAVVEIPDAVKQQVKKTKRKVAPAVEKAEPASVVEPASVPAMESVSDVLLARQLEAVRDRMSVSNPSLNDIPDAVLMRAVQQAMADLTSTDALN